MAMLVARHLRNAAPEGVLVPSPALAPTDLRPMLPGSAEGMAAFLDRACPISDAEALRLLRASFPGTSLSERVAACALWKR